MRRNIGSIILAAAASAKWQRNVAEIQRRKYGNQWHQYRQQRVWRNKAKAGNTCKWRQK